MYFSKRKRDAIKNSMIILSALCFIILISTSIPLLQPVGCHKRGPFSTSGLCKHYRHAWNLFYHLGGNGPWIPRKTVDSLSLTLPTSCSVEQIHLLSRHAERYPTKNAFRRHLDLLQKLKNPQVHLQGSLAFIRNWSYFTDIENPVTDDLIAVGPYAGTLQAHTTGRKLRGRYRHLLTSSLPTNFWTCSSPRDVETARHFADGFFGHGWEELGGARLNIISENSDRGGNTLTPGDTCSKYLEDKLEGHDKGYRKLAQWQKEFTPSIHARLKNDFDQLYMTPLEMYGMMEICGFEMIARGHSPWCNIFTHEEWLQFEYARDVLHFYRAGPGNMYAGAMGGLWLNATLRLLEAKVNQNLYFSFVHDSDVIAVVAAMGILDEVDKDQTLPVSFIKENRRWKTSDVVPMGGHLLLEKVTCDNQSIPQRPLQTFIRLLINDGVYDLEEITGITGFSGMLPLEQFAAYVRKRGDQFGNFVDVCQLPLDSPASITFFEH